MSPFDVVFAALDAHGCKPSRRGDKVSALCPAHDDNWPSLSLGVGDDGRALLYCFAQCDTAKVVSLLGLQMSDLFAAFEERPQRRHRGPTKKRPPAGAQDTSYAIVPRSLPETMDPYCVALFACLDVRQGHGQYRAHGDQFIANVLGWQARTVRDHALHLAGAGWIGILKRGTGTGAHGTTEYEVIHNPPRKIVNPNATTPLRATRSRPESRVAALGDTHQTRAGVARQTRVRLATDSATWDIEKQFDYADAGDFSRALALGDAISSAASSAADALLSTALIGAVVRVRSYLGGVVAWCEAIQVNSDDFLVYSCEDLLARLEVLRSAVDRARESLSLQRDQPVKVPGKGDLPIYDHDHIDIDSADAIAAMMRKYLPLLGST